MFDDKKKRFIIFAVAFIALLSVAAITIVIKNAQAKTIRAERLSASGKPFSSLPQATTSALPPLPEPYINTVLEGKRHIVIRNNRRDPIRVIADIDVSSQAYGNGFLNISNLSHKGVAALKGEFSITTTSGDVIRDGWSFSYGGKIYLPGATQKVPVGGPIRPIVDAPYKIASIGITITGIVFDDKSYWGANGLSLLQKASLEAKNLGLMAQKIKSECLNMSTAEIANELGREVPNPVPLAEWKSGRFDLDPVSYVKFSRGLLDENKALKPDYMYKLDTLIENCKKLSE